MEAKLPVAGFKKNDRKLWQSHEEEIGQASYRTTAGNKQT